MLSLESGSTVIIAGVPPHYYHYLRCVGYRSLLRRPLSFQAGVERAVNRQRTATTNTSLWAA